MIQTAHTTIQCTEDMLKQYGEKVVVQTNKKYTASRPTSTNPFLPPNKHKTLTK